MGLAQDLVQALWPEAFGQGLHPFMVRGRVVGLRGMRALFLLPWGLFLLGLVPLVGVDPVGEVGRGLGLLMAALLVAAVGSLYSRFPVAFPVQFFLVLGLGLLAFQLSLESALFLTGLRALGTPPWEGCWGRWPWGWPSFWARGSRPPFSLPCRGWDAGGPPAPGGGPGGPGPEAAPGPGLPRHPGGPGGPGKGASPGGPGLRPPRGVPFGPPGGPPRGCLGAS